MVQKERALVEQDEQWPRLEEVVVDCLNRALAQGNQPLPRGAPGTPHMALQQIHVVAIERDELADPHSGSVERFEHRAISDGFRSARRGVALPRGLLQETFDLAR